MNVKATETSNNDYDPDLKSHQWCMYSEYNNSQEYEYECIRVRPSESLLFVSYTNTTVVVVLVS